MQGRLSRRCRAVVETMQSRRRDDAEPFVETSVGAYVETIVRLPSILVLHVSRALELQIGL